MAKLPKYDISEVRKAALAQRITYRGRRVQNNITDLGYDLSDVATCIASLTVHDFQKSHKYDGGHEDDSYICKPSTKEQKEDFPVSIYIKIALIQGEIHLEIDLASFHT